jgi:hypothetical protein
MAVRSGWLLPALAALTGCTALHNAALPIPAITAAPLPDSRYTQEPLPRVRGSAAWRPAAVEHVLNLDGQRCTVVDLAMRCTSPAHAAAALAVDAAIGATEPTSTDVKPVDSGSVE